MKNSRVDFRANSAEKEKFAYAASLLHTNVSGFLRNAALKLADEVIKLHGQVVLDDKARDAFLSALDKPPKPNRRLVQAMKKYKDTIRKK